jgi:hypothetical protein
MNRYIIERYLNHDFMFENKKEKMEMRARAGELETLYV